MPRATSRLPLIDRRRCLAGLGVALLSPGPSRAQTLMIADGAGRLVPVPPRVERVFPAGPPAAVLVYTLAPDLLLGWPSAVRPEARPFLLPDAADRPEVGRLTGRGDTVSLQALLALQPDLILDYGTTSDTYVQLADKVENDTGISYVLLDGRIEAIGAAFRTLGDLTGRHGRAATLAAYADDVTGSIKAAVAKLPDGARPKVYYARGPKGLETASGDSILTEAIAFLGGRNVAGETGGMRTVTINDVKVWNPDIIIAVDQAFAKAVKTDALWKGVAAVDKGKVFAVPRLPFGWLEPPSVNRLIGVQWLASLFYPDLVPQDMKALAGTFYGLFYHVQPGEADIAALLTR